MTIGSLEHVKKLVPSIIVGIVVGLNRRNIVE